MNLVKVFSKRNLAYIRKLNGINMSNDLIGIDRPDYVDKLYKEKEEWIFEKK